MNSQELATSMFGAFLGVYSLIYLAIFVLILVSMWKIFVKAGMAGWKCLIPFYNCYCMYKFTWGNGWLFLLLLIPVVNVVIGIIYNVKLAKAFGQGTGFALGLIFLSVIFLPILAFGKSEYVGPQN